MESLERSRIAAQVSALLNGTGRDAPDASCCQVIEESFRIKSRQPRDGGRSLLEFEFQGLVENMGEPVVYSASGAVMIDSAGIIDPETITF